MKAFLIKHKDIIVPASALLTIFSIIVLTMLPKTIKWIDKNFFFSGRIYLILTDSDKHIKLINEDKPIVFPRKIKKDNPIKFCFSLIQDNNPAPEISIISVIFPDTTTVLPHPYEGLTWRRSNSSRNEYFLDCHSSKRFTRRAIWNLPILEVVFKDPAKILLEYTIIGNDMKDIRRTITVYGDTDLVYSEEYKNYMQKYKKYSQAERLPDSATSGVEYFARPKEGNIIAIDHNEGKIIHTDDIKIEEPAKK